MNFEFWNNTARFRFGFRFHSNLDLEPQSKSKSIRLVIESSHNHVVSNIKQWRRSIQSMLPWVADSKIETRVSLLDKEMERYVGSQRAESGCRVPLFRPYVAKVPWHKGARAFLSQFFPRYGHYCGPNWSSGKDNGSLVWDRRPIDWLDFCCYCHDIGYDSHDQAKLLKADLAFLECLEKPHMSTKGDANIAHLYKTMFITGLRNILIPYRRQLVKLQAGQSPVEWLGNVTRKDSTCQQA